MKTMRRAVVGCAVLLSAACRLVGAQPAEQQPKFENEAGWVWHMRPQPASWESISGEGLAMRLDELKDQKLLLTLAHAVDANREVVHFRLVAYNAARQRFEFKWDSGGSSDNAALKAYLVDLKSLPRAKSSSSASKS